MVNDDRSEHIPSREAIDKAYRKMRDRGEYLIRLRTGKLVRRMVHKDRRTGERWFVYAGDRRTPVRLNPAAKSPNGLPVDYEEADD